MARAAAVAAAVGSAAPIAPFGRSRAARWEGVVGAVCAAIGGRPEAPLFLRLLVASDNAANAGDVRCCGGAQATAALCVLVYR